MNINEYLSYVWKVLNSLILRSINNLLYIIKFRIDLLYGVQSYPSINFSIPGLRILLLVSSLSLC
jgi:hypothetical protein